MQKTEFQKKILEKKRIDKEIYNLSMEIDDFPIARQILNIINNSIHLDTFLNSPNEQIAIVSKRDLYLENIALIKDSLLRGASSKFLDELLDLKILDFRRNTLKRSKSTRSKEKLKPNNGTNNKKIRLNKNEIKKDEIKKPKDRKQKDKKNNLIKKQKTKTNKDVIYTYQGISYKKDKDRNRKIISNSQKEKYLSKRQKKQAKTLGKALGTGCVGCFTAVAFIILFLIFLIGMGPIALLFLPGAFIFFILTGL